MKKFFEFLKRYWRAVVLVSAALVLISVSAWLSARVQRRRDMAAPFNALTRYCDGVLSQDDLKAVAQNGCYLLTLGYAAGSAPVALLSYPRFVKEGIIRADCYVNLPESVTNYVSFLMGTSRKYRVSKYSLDSVGHPLSQEAVVILTDDRHFVVIPGCRLPAAGERCPVEYDPQGRLRYFVGTSARVVEPAGSHSSALDLEAAQMLCCYMRELGFLST